MLLLPLNWGTTYFKRELNIFHLFASKIFSKNNNTKQQQTKNCVRLGHYSISEGKYQSQRDTFIGKGFQSQNCAPHSLVHSPKLCPSWLWGYALSKAVWHARQQPASAIVTALSDVIIWQNRHSKIGIYLFPLKQFHGTWNNLSYEMNSFQHT